MLGNNCLGASRGTEGLEGEGAGVFGKDTGIGGQTSGLFSWSCHSQTM